jgi:hypothetical protein
MLQSVHRNPVNFPPPSVTVFTLGTAGLTSSTCPACNVKVLIAHKVPRKHKFPAIPPINHNNEFPVLFKDSLGTVVPVLDHQNYQVFTIHTQHLHQCLRASERKQLSIIRNRIIRY